MNKYPHYHKPVEGLKTVDVYRVLELFEVNDHAIGHAIKKLMCAGKRGGKDFETDIREAVDTLNRRLQMIAEDDGCKRIEAFVEDAMMPTDKDGFRNWSGNIMAPCPLDSIVTVRFADGEQAIGVARFMKWVHLNRPTDIVGWKYASEDTQGHVDNMWFPHDGSPIPPFATDVKVQVWFRNSTKPCETLQQASTLRWNHQDMDGDIIRWRYAS